MKTKQIIVPFTLSAEPTSEGVFEGYGSVFGNEDAYGDVVEKGAFAASLEAWKAKGRSPAMLWQHYASRPIGVWTKMVEDEHGLRVTGKLAVKTNDGRDAYEHLLAGTVSGLSIGYAIPKGGAEWDPKSETYRLKQLDLWETSLVTFPANDEARVGDVKSAIGNPKDFERFLRHECGLGREQAKALMARGYQGILATRDAGSEGAGPDQGAREANALAVKEVIGSLDVLINAVRKGK